MSEVQIALIVALFKLYDNYRTPLSSNVKCYKSRYQPKWSNPRFVVWMEILNIDTSVDKIGFLIPDEYWDKFKVMIEYDRIPKDIVMDEEGIAERLMKL